MKNHLTAFTMKLAAGTVIGGLMLVAGSYAQDQEQPVAPQPDAQEQPATQPQGQQQSAPQMMLQQPTMQPDEVGVEELEAAAVVQQKAEELNQRLQKKLTDIDDHEFIKEQIDQAEAELEATAGETGISLDEYEQIMRAIEQDQELQRDFLLLVRGEPELERADLNTGELDQAAEIFMKLQQLRQHLQSALAGIEDQAAAQEIITKAESSLDDKAEAAGMKLERYEKIMELLQYDLDLQEDFMEIIKAELPQQPQQQPEQQQDMPVQPME